MSDYDAGQTTPYAYAIVDEALRLVQASARFQSLMARATPGVNIDHLLPVFAGAESVLQAIARAELPYWHLWAVTDAAHPENTNPRYLELFAAPHVTPGHLLLMVRDATPEMVVEQSLMQRRNEYRAAASLPAASIGAETPDGDRWRLLSALAHRLRIPLIHILGYTEWLLDAQHPTLSDEQRAALSHILENGIQADAFVAELLHHERTLSEDAAQLAEH